MRFEEESGSNIVWVMDFANRLGKTKLWRKKVGRKWMVNSKHLEIVIQTVKSKAAQEQEERRQAAKESKEREIQQLIQNATEDWVVIQKHYVYQMEEGISTLVYCIHCSQEISSKNYESYYHTEECTTCRRMTGIGKCRCVSYEKIVSVSCPCQSC
jgi:hypothetical protein